MTKKLSALALLALLSTAAGCATPYKPPTMAQPHAIVKLRRTYQTSGGTHMREHLSIDGHPAFAAHDASEAAGTPRTDALLVHPTTAELTIGAGFFHTESRLVSETYYVQVPYSTTESYSCGKGRTCSRSTTRYRSEARYRTVLRQVEVSDGACATAIWLSPALDGAYLIEYEYAQDTLCRIACFDQVPGAEPDTFDNRPCRPPSPEDIRRAKKAR